VTPRILVTGATGFVGRAVVRELLDAGRSVTVLARGRAGASAAARVAEAVGVTPGDARVDLVEGDLSAPACGIDDPGWRTLRESVDTVIHCAGDTTFAPARSASYEAVHVAGPRRLLQTLAAGLLRRWVHVSTAYVCGAREGLIREADGDLGQAFHNAYERAKLASETALRAAGARAGVQVRVARPAIVVGRAPLTPGGAPSNLLFEFVRLAATLAASAMPRAVALRIEAAADAPFNVVPLGYVAAALCHLAEATTEDRTFHLVTHAPPTQAEVLRTIAERLDVSGPSLVEALDDPTPLERRVARMLRGHRPYLGQHVIFDDANARRTLPPALARRSVVSRRTLHALIDVALTTDGGPAPGRRRPDYARAVR
jgi:dihydroflavonol-4-reductase